MNRVWSRDAYKEGDAIECVSGPNKARTGKLQEKVQERVWTVSWDDGGVCILHEANMEKI